MNERELEIKKKVLAECREFTRHLEGLLREIENVQSLSLSNDEKERLHKRYLEVVEIISIVNSKAGTIFSEAKIHLIKRNI